MPDSAHSDLPGTDADARRPAAATTARIVVNGVSLIADLSGALYWPDRRMLVVADLHLEKGSASAARGRLLPPYDTAATLRRLAAVIERYSPDCVVCLGDSFDDRRAADRVAADDGERIAALVARQRWWWIVGNHDPDPPARWGGRVADELVVGAIVLRHEARAGAVGEVSGHYHPKAAVRVRYSRVSGRCFVSDGRRLVMPAFGAYTGGLDVLCPAISGLMDRRFDVHILGRRRIQTLPSTRLARPG